MIELDLKGTGWPGRALAAVACHRQWLSVRLGSGFTSRVSRLDGRHLVSSHAVGYAASEWSHLRCGG